MIRKREGERLSCCCSSDDKKYGEEYEEKE